MTTPLTTGHAYPAGFRSEQCSTEPRALSHGHSVGSPSSRSTEKSTDLRNGPGEQEASCVCLALWGRESLSHSWT